jgi:hypothetical protein
MEEFEINDAEMEMLSKVKLTDGIPWLFDQGDIDDIMPTACGFQPRSGDVAIG